MAIYSVSHTTHYGYAEALYSATQRLLLRPQHNALQQVKHWDIHLTGAQMMLESQDHHGNGVNLTRYQPPYADITIVAAGVVETQDNNGVYGQHDNALPLALFRRETQRTQIGKELRQCLREFKNVQDCRDQRIVQEPIVFLHALSAYVLKALPYQKGVTNNDMSAEEALSNGSGVCQDHVHIFLSLARQFGFAARYISGYLMMEGVAEQEAMHAWAEAYVPHMGWVGYDISNQISPDHRYIRVATGFDYQDIMPVAGVRSGQGDEQLEISIQVQQQ